MYMTKRLLKRVSVILCLALVITMVPIGQAKADTDTITVTPEGGDISLTSGETKQLSVGTSIEMWGQTYSVSRYTFISDRSDVASVDASGKLTALHSGYAEICVEVYTNSYSNRDTDDDLYDDDSDDYGYNSRLNENGSEYLLFQTYYGVIVSPNLSNIQIDRKSQTGYTGDTWNMPVYTFHLKSKEVLSEDWDTLVLSCSSSNKKISVYGELQDNVLTITPYGIGKTVVTVKINGKKLFDLTIETILIEMSTNSALLSVKQTKQLNVKGCKKSAVKWSSSNPKVASVSSNGLVKAKKTGNAVIKAKIGDFMFGCAVSVVTPKKKNAINTAIRIAKTCTYSQPLRMQSKYYDCSSLVWKAYHKNGVNFGNANYAPVAADIGKWCATKGKMVKGGLSMQNINNMKINAGDVMFRTGEKNGRYRGIYHVEMIVGYVCRGFDYNGKPILELKYAARNDGYADGCGEPVGRP